MMGRNVLVDLVNQSAEIVPKQGQWRVLYVAFARAGWSEPAHQYAQALQGAPPAGTNWRGVAMQLVDLLQVDHDLQRWTS